MTTENNVAWVAWPNELVAAGALTCAVHYDKIFNQRVKVRSGLNTSTIYKITLFKTREEAAKVARKNLRVIQGQYFSLVEQNPVIKLLSDIDDG